METVEVLVNMDRTMRLYKEYYRYKQKLEFKKIPAFFLYSLTSIIIIIGWIASIHFLFKVGIISLGAVVVFQLFYLILFKIATLKTISQLKKIDSVNGEKIKFSFDTDGFYYNPAHVNTRIKWTDVSRYELNGSKIYITCKAINHFDIITEEIMGSENFKLFTNLLLNASKEA